MMDTLSKARTFMISRREILLRMRNVLGKSCRENKNIFYI
jgi:hypothetical protein